jgi:hypothetical protein
MAIIVGGVTECPVCGTAILPDDAFWNFPHFIQDPSHPLWRFSDCGMHRRCFQGWEHAEAYRAAFDILWPRLVPNHPRRMVADGSIVDV